jgi:hypothetical protein
MLCDGWVHLTRVVACRVCCSDGADAALVDHQRAMAAVQAVVERLTQEKVLLFSFVYAGIGAGLLVCRGFSDDVALAAGAVEHAS